jgi:hypothetical protein
MPFVKGKSGNPKGKKPGTPTKQTQSVKEAFKLAFEGIGGVPAFTKWAKKEQSEFYKIYSKLLPKELEVSGTDGGPIKAQVEVIFADSKHKS